MNLISVGKGKGKGDVAFAYGHDKKKVRLRAVNAEKEIYSSLINAPASKKISVVQIVLAVLVTLMQIVAIGLVYGRWSDVDRMTGTGFWTSFISVFAALQTLYCVSSPNYWKLHLAFALHIFSFMAHAYLVISEFVFNIPYIRYRLAMNDLPVDPNRVNDFYIFDKLSSPMLLVCLALNTGMAAAGVVQFVSSFVMTLMTGRAMCCSQSKVDGKIFAIDLTEEEVVDGVIAFKKTGQQKCVYANHVPIMTHSDSSKIV